MHFLGSHCLDNGGIHMAAKRAGRAGMTALQVCTAIPKFYNDKMSAKPERVARFREALAETAIEPRHVLVHAAYVLNCATPDVTKWERAAAGLAKEYERSTAFGAGGVCFHPGAATDGDRESGIRRVALAMQRALEAVPDSHTRLLIENTAGAGTTVGRTAEEIAAILAAIPAELRERAGYGLDTCHMLASGFDIATSHTELVAILDEFENDIGEPPAFFHLNDSEGALGSNRDRHALIGEGQIGIEAFNWLLSDHRSKNVPLILETPQANPDIADDDDSPDSNDLLCMERLKALAGWSR